MDQLITDFAALIEKCTANTTTHDSSFLFTQLRATAEELASHFNIEQGMGNVTYPNILESATKILTRMKIKRADSLKNIDDNKIAGIIYGTKKTPDKVFYGGGSANIAIGYAAMESKPRGAYDPNDPLYTLDTLLEKIAASNGKYRTSDEKFQLMGLLASLSDQLIMKHNLDDSFRNAPDWECGSLNKEEKGLGKEVYKAMRISMAVHDISLNEELEQPLPDNIEIKEMPTLPCDDDSDDEMPPLMHDSDDESENAPDDEPENPPEDYFTIGKLIGQDFKANGFADKRASVMLTSFETYLNQNQWKDLLDGYHSAMGDEE